MVMQILDLHELLELLLSDTVTSIKLICGQVVLSRTDLLQDNQKHLHGEPLDV